MPFSLLSMKLFDRFRKAKSDAEEIVKPEEIAKPVEIVPYTLSQAHRHWLNDKKALRYANADPVRSEFLVDKVSELFPKTISIQEIGCNAGRNLHYLYEAGFTNLSAVELSPTAITVLKDLP